MAEQYQIPQNMNAAILKEWSKPTEFGQLPVPTLEAGQVLVQVKAAPINPSDLSFMNHFYPVPAKLPTAPGFEGSGLVVKAFSEKEQHLVGKRIAFFGVVGTYAEYVSLNATSALPIPDSVSYDVAASSFINPLTVLSMLQTTQEAKVKAVVQTAAASSLGKQLVRHFQANGIEVINIVRRQEQADQLTKIGAKHVLNQTDSDFEAKLKELSAKLDARIAFDAIAGEITGTIINSQPAGSTIYVYGGLSGQNVSNVGIGSLVFERKTVTGYWLSNEINRRTAQQNIELISSIPELLKGNLSSEISKEFTYKDFNEAVAYYTKNMSAGKVLIKP